MAINNIIVLLNSYISNPNFENIIFCWTLHKQEILDKIFNSLIQNFDFYHFSLMCSDEIISERIIKRSIDRSKRLDIPYSAYDIQKDIDDAIDKKPFYYENDAIKLNGDDTLDNLYETVVSNINLSDKKCRTLN